MYAQAGMFPVPLVFPHWYTYTRIFLQLVSSPLENIPKISPAFVWATLLASPPSSSPDVSSPPLDNRVYLVMVYGISRYFKYIAGWLWCKSVIKWKVKTQYDLKRYAQYPVDFVCTRACSVFLGWRIGTRARMSRHKTITSMNILGQRRIRAPGGSQ